MHFNLINKSYIRNLRVSISYINTQSSGGSLKLSLFIALLILSVFSCKEEKTSTLPVFKEVSVSNTRPRYLIPYPNNIIYSNDEFLLKKKLCYSGTPTGLEPALLVMDKFYKGIIERWQRTSRELFLRDTDKNACTSIHFTKNNQLGKEAYRLSIQDSIVIEYNESAGAFYALQTLKQIIRNSAYTTVGPKLAISKIKIDDEARFEYRGIHLDVSRHFIPTKDIKRFIKMLSEYKINKFHWHLTDDQGWRIEIKRYPKLQQISSHRSQTITGRNPLKFDGKDHGGFYSQREIRSIVAYAQTLFVEIIPEIEMPGHSRALLAAYPELSCRKTRLPVETKWGVFDHVLCPKDTTIAFMKNVLREVMVLFPSQYIHIGGDECNTTEWANSSECQTIMTQHNYNNVDQLYGHFINQIVKFIEENGKKVIGWDEIVDNNIEGDITVMGWRGVDKALEAAGKGHDVIMTPMSFCYLNFYQSLDSTEPKSHSGGYLPLEKVYSYNPVPDGVSDEIKKHIIGTQGNLWTEYMKDFSEVSYMAFPRVLAIAENGWTRNDKKSWERFGNNIDVHIPHIRKSRFKYSKKLYEPSYETYNQNGLVFLKLIQKMKAGYIKYWSTRSNSERLSQVYQEPILLTEETNIRIKYFSSTQKFATLNQYINFKSNMATGHHILMRNNKAEEFKPVPEMDVLVNGIEGNTDNLVYNQEWKLLGENTEFMLDLKDTISARNLELTFIQSSKKKTNPTLQLNIEIGENTTDLKPIDKFDIRRTNNDNSSNYTINIRDKSIRYIKISPIISNKNGVRIYIGEILIK